MDFKISDTNQRKRSLIYDGFIYRIDGVLKCGDISWWCTNNMRRRSRNFVRGGGGGGGGGGCGGVQVSLTKKSSDVFFFNPQLILQKSNGHRVPTHFSISNSRTFPGLFQVKQVIFKVSSMQNSRTFPG